MTMSARAEEGVADLRVGVIRQPVRGQRAGWARPGAGRADAPGVVLRLPFRCQAVSAALNTDPVLTEVPQLVARRSTAGTMAIRLVKSAPSGGARGQTERQLPR
jgi:hypothetical protein